MGPEYLISEGIGRAYVTKWEGGKEPAQIYEVVQKKQRYFCSCPAAIYRKGRCKHIKMIKGLTGGK